jgi:transposase-like protein
MEAGVTELTGVPWGERNPGARLVRRNGYRDRRWDTRVGTVELAIPRVRDGSYFPSLLEPRRRAERALLAVVRGAYVLGSAPAASTRSPARWGSAPRRARRLRLLPRGPALRDRGPGVGRVR